MPQYPHIGFDGYLDNICWNSTHDNDSVSPENSGLACTPSVCSGFFNYTIVPCKVASRDLARNHQPTGGRVASALSYFELRPTATDVFSIAVGHANSRENQRVLLGFEAVSHALLRSGRPHALTNVNHPQVRYD